MAKELPYFKFEPNQWDNGNIQICNREDKGLFIDLCSMYWSRLGEVPFKLAVQKLCNGNATAFDSLIKEEIFEVIDGMICIDFLNEQLSEFENISNQNSKNAKEGWEKRRKKAILSNRNASALNSQSESDAIREEEMREEEIREEESYPPNPFIHGKKIFEFLCSDDDLQMRLSKNTQYPDAVIHKKIAEFCERESLNGGKTLSNWRDYCYKSILKNYKNNGTSKPKNRNR